MLLVSRKGPTNRNDEVRGCDVELDNFDTREETGLVELLTGCNHQDN